ncbi:class I SAM-dependent methyltransferase [Kordiimonas sp. SCSIO 12610]|uniref:class I SAM-dependent methyltransferase n=1 Tax=Kordiimonas sp. SCSIO 12610 TaxID=2829597 RepID=UPI00210C932A|nr:SAM-dependent methyltransferase [Kordiimonas sp. SCSIO 12610]UTW54972.1 SAM-dependent methyltransferase [Kordiimonas sp. SCSIO 12610]
MSAQRSLQDKLERRIAALGPISIADYMRECLMDPEFGYYQQQVVFGEKGDFTTAPEISQMFGEIIGLKLAEKWLLAGSPKNTMLIELGPGRGTLMADILRATKMVPNFHEAIDIHFVETSKQLKTLQKEKVPDANWHDQIHDVPEGFSLIVANEFFDALPIHQFEKKDGIWFERMVATKNGALEYVLSNPGPQFSLVPSSFKAKENGSIYEVCPAALSITGIVSERIKKYGGSAIIIDYGYIQSTGGDTFQALKHHTYVPTLENPGSADLTAHVAFDQLANVAKEIGVKVNGAFEQGAFLMQAGIGERAQNLAKDAPEDLQKKILGELVRLTAPDQMGQLFKVLLLNHIKFE